MRYHGNQVTETLDDAKFAREASRAYVADARGLTNSIVRQLGVPLEEDLPTDADGYIAYDAEVIEDLFREAHANKFALPVLNFSADMLAIVELEQKKSDADSSSLSASSASSPG